MINNVVGSPAVGDNFFARHDEQARLWKRLSNDNVLLLAPRRVGKTSLLRRLEATASEHGYEAVYVSVADCTTEIGFLARIYDALARSRGGTEAARAALTSFLRRFTRVRRIDLANVVSAEFADQAGAEWQGLGDALAKQLRDTDCRWLVLVDELPLFVLALLRTDRDRARTFLGWFREARIDERAHASVRWLIAGSIGLDTVAARHRLGDTINDLAAEPLGPFSTEVAKAFLQALASRHGLTLEEDTRQAILGRVGWLIPYHLQLVFSVLIASEDRSPSPSRADAAYRSLFDPTYKAAFDWWVQRLHDELGSVDAGHAHAVLAAVARDDAGVSRSVLAEAIAARGNADPTHHAFLLDALESDGYFARLDGRYHFRSPLLRDYWRARVL